MCIYTDYFAWLEPYLAFDARLGFLDYSWAIPISLIRAIASTQTIGTARFIRLINSVSWTYNPGFIPTWDFPLGDLSEKTWFFRVTEQSHRREWQPVRGVLHDTAFTTPGTAPCLSKPISERDTSSPPLIMLSQAVQHQHLLQSVLNSNPFLSHHKIPGGKLWHLFN